MKGYKLALLVEMVENIELNGIERDPMIFDGIIQKLNTQEMEQLRDIIIALSRKVSN